MMIRLGLGFLAIGILLLGVSEQIHAACKSEENCCPVPPTIRTVFVNQTGCKCFFEGMVIYFGTNKKNCERLDNYSGIHCEDYVATDPEKACKLAQADAEAEASKAENCSAISCVSSRNPTDSCQQDEANPTSSNGAPVPNQDGSCTAEVNTNCKCGE